jgi:hypothetical protein
MAIEGLNDLSSLSVRELYAVYRGIAESDLKWRLRTMYGDKSPVGRAEFRPLPFELFHERFVAAQGLDRGESMLRERLSRQAAAYRVDVDSAIARLQQAA